MPRMIQIDKTVIDQINGTIFCPLVGLPGRPKTTFLVASAARGVRKSSNRSFPWPPNG
jgi:hypothetical protein